MPNQLALRKIISRICARKPRDMRLLAVVLLVACGAFAVEPCPAEVPRSKAYRVDKQTVFNEAAHLHSFKSRQHRSLIAIAAERPTEADLFAAGLHTAIAFAPANGPLSLPPLLIEDRPDARPILGIASTYNPYAPGRDAGGPETASGEAYDAGQWTAAIQTELRGAFGGVRYGRNYRPAYALVCDGSKRAIVKINDVGPLLPGRVVDLNEHVMRYFDPMLQRGLLRSVSVTPLPGEAWSPGPVRGRSLFGMAGDFLYEPIL